jgi:hypothetical protein
MDADIAAGRAHMGKWALVNPDFTPRLETWAAEAQQLVHTGFGAKRPLP